MRALVAACTAGLVTASLPVAPARAQPDAAADLAAAKRLYDNATAAMAAGRYEAAARDFTAAYSIAKDPVLFFKIGEANEKAGKCDVALEYYRRYINEAKPAPAFVQLAMDHIAACGGQGSAAEGSGSAAAGLAGSAAIEAGSATTAPETGSAGSASSREPGSAATGSAALGSAALGSAAPAPAPAPFGRVRREDTPWLFGGAALAFVTLGAVLAYSASSSENDVRDLYDGVDHMPVTYDATTAQRYHDLVAEGHRYEYLSWSSFAIAAAFAGLSAWWFVHAHNQHQLVVAPAPVEHGAGVGAIVRF